jgi:hypothetical protein
MGTKRHRKSKPDVSDPLCDLFVELGLNPKEWQVQVDYRKGALTKDRWTVVEVTNLRTGKTKQRAAASGTKGEAHRRVAGLVRECVLSLRGY